MPQVSGNCVTKEDVQRYFQDLVTDESMYTLIYGYLTDAKINVEGFDAPQQKNQDASANTTDIPDDADPADLAAGSQKQKTPESNEALFFHEMYLDELAALTKHEDSQISGFLKDLGLRRPFFRQCNHRALSSARHPDRRPLR